MAMCFKLPCACLVAWASLSASGMSLRLLSDWLMEDRAFGCGRVLLCWAVAFGSLEEGAGRVEVWFLLLSLSVTKKGKPSNTQSFVH